MQLGRYAKKNFQKTLMFAAWNDEEKNREIF